MSNERKGVADLGLRFGVSNESLTGKVFALHSRVKKSPKVLDTNALIKVVDNYYLFSI